MTGNLLLITILCFIAHKSETRRMSHRPILREIAGSLSNMSLSTERET